MDSAKKFGMDNKKISFMVDSVSKVISIPKNKILPSANIMAKVDMDYLEGVVNIEEKQILVLNFEKVLHKSKKMESISLLKEVVSLLDDEEKKELKVMMSDLLSK